MTVENLFNITNEDYQMDGDTEPMWYIFTSQRPTDDGNVQHLTAVVGPSTQPSNEVIEWMDKEVSVGEGGAGFTYRGGFPYEPSEEELAQFAPEGYIDVPNS